MNGRIILGISGNIGVGKTTLVERLAKYWGWDFYKEPAGENPYLKLYYEEPERWGLHSQIYFLANRFEEELRLSNLGKSYILDRTIYEDGEVFAKIALREKEYKTYLKLYKLAIRYLPKPNLIIYLRAPVDVLMKRIKKRKRKEEGLISYEYIEKLNEAYEEWLKGFKKTKVVVYDAKEDIIENIELLISLIEREMKSLTGKG
ncbi:MAG: deoxynucleoside kinase [bacterium]|nr:deoxynucleoside kinase [bacterium]